MNNSGIVEIKKNASLKYARHTLSYKSGTAITLQKCIASYIIEGFKFDTSLVPHQIFTLISQK